MELEKFRVIQLAKKKRIILSDAMVLERAEAPSKLNHCELPRNAGVKRGVKRKFFRVHCRGEGAAGCRILDSDETLSYSFSQIRLFIFLRLLFRSFLYILFSLRIFGQFVKIKFGSRFEGQFNWRIFFLCRCYFMFIYYLILDQ